MTAVVSVPAALAERVGGVLSRGVPIPTKEAPDVGRTYFCVPLFSLAGADLFTSSDIDVEYFDTRTEAEAWGEADIQQRRARQAGGR
jgi:hypothetical protein